MVAELHRMMDHRNREPKEPLTQREKLVRHGVPAVVIAIGAITAGSTVALNHLNKSIEIGTHTETVPKGDGAINTIEQGIRDILEDHPSISYNSVEGSTSEGLEVNGQFIQKNNMQIQPGTKIDVAVKQNNWGHTYVEASLTDPSNLAHLEQTNK